MPAPAKRRGRTAPVNVATFAQPSGLALDGNTLYVADAEANIDPRR